jgi:hypothetical protein
MGEVIVESITGSAVGALDLALGTAAIMRHVSAETARGAARVSRERGAAVVGRARRIVAHPEGVGAQAPEAVRARLAEGAALRARLVALVVRRWEQAVPAAVDLVLDQLDLTALVARRVDLDRLVAQVDVDAVAARLDIDVIIARIDLIARAQEVVDGIDLPGIIRQSTGSMASDGVREVRSRGIEADQALAHFVDRRLLRRRSARSAAVAPPLSGGAGAD